MKRQKPSLSLKVRIIEKVEANPLPLMCVEMAKHFGLVPSLLRNIILTKDKIKEAGMKRGVQVAKIEWKNMKAGLDAVTPTT
jgi:hypothetical protein